MAKISREKSAADKRAIELQKAQDKNIRQAGNRRLIGTTTDMSVTAGPPNLGRPFEVKPPKSKIKDTPKPKPGGSFEIPAAMKAAAASKVAQAIKKSKGLGMLNVPIMTKGSADKIFKDFFGKQDYSS